MYFALLRLSTVASSIYVRALALDAASQRWVRRCRIRAMLAWHKPSERERAAGDASTTGSLKSAAAGCLARGGSRSLTLPRKSGWERDGARRGRRVYYTQRTLARTGDVLPRASLASRGSIFRATLVLSSSSPSSSRLFSSSYSRCQALYTPRRLYREKSPANDP